MKISRKDAKTQKNLGVFASLREAKNDEPTDGMRVPLKPRPGDDGTETAEELHV